MTHHVARPLLHEPDSSAPPPSVSVTLGLVNAGGVFDGTVVSTFQGYDPAVTGSLSLVVGRTAYAVPGANPAFAALAPIVAASPVLNPTVLLDLPFSTPAQGAQNATQVDVSVAANTKGFASLALPLAQAIAGTTLGNELQPLLGLTGGLLPGFGAKGGVPQGGSTTALPWFSANVQAGFANTVTVLGSSTVTSGSGSVHVTQATGKHAVAAAQALTQVIGSGQALLADVQGGNLLGAVADGTALLGNATTLGTSIAPLLADAARQGDPALPSVQAPALSLGIDLATGQSYSLGLGSPAQVDESLHVTLVADQFGAYALGKLAAEIVPQLITDLSGGVTQTTQGVLYGLTQGLLTLAQDAQAGFAGQGGAGAVPSRLAGPDIVIQATLVTSETKDTALGATSLSQTYGFGVASNAQGFYDLGTAAQPALTDLLVGLLETKGGQEALQIGGQILSQLDHLLGGGTATAVAPHEALFPAGVLSHG